MKFFVSLFICFGSVHTARKYNHLSILVAVGLVLWSCVLAGWCQIASSVLGKVEWVQHDQISIWFSEWPSLLQKLYSAIIPPDDHLATSGNRKTTALPSGDSQKTHSMDSCASDGFTDQSFGGGGRGGEPNKHAAVLWATFIFTQLRINFSLRRLVHSSWL